MPLGAQIPQIQESDVFLGDGRDQIDRNKSGGICGISGGIAFSCAFVACPWSEDAVALLQFAWLVTLLEVSCVGR